MRKVIFGLVAVAWMSPNLAWSDDSLIWLPNIPAYATGTQVGGKNGLDVNVIQTSPVIFPSTLPVILVSPIPLPVILAGPSPGASAIPVTQTPNANGDYIQVSVTATESSTAAPANAIGLVLESESGNLLNIRWGVSNSGTAILSSSTGVLMEPGRSVDYFPVGVGAFLHYITVSNGTETLDMQWILSK